MSGDTTHNRQAGFSLIEILVTMVVLSIGLLGIAGMQASGLRNNHAAYTKTQATNLAMDMAERIRANPQGLANYAGFDTNGTIPASTGCISTSTGCSPTDLATHDKIEWSIPILGKNATVTQTTKPVLPAGRGLITRDANDEFTITILWREVAYEGMERNDCGQVGLADDMACFQMSFKPRMPIAP